MLDRLPGFRAGLALLLFALAAHAEAPWRGKVHPLVLERSAAGDVEFIVVLREQAKFAPADDRALVVERLQAVAARTQGPLIAYLRSRNLEYRAFWIANTVWVRGDGATVETLARRPDVLRLDANPRIRVLLPEGVEAPEAPPGGTPEWGVQKVRADQVWALGYDGNGVVVGGLDTGVEWVHPALQGQYRGWDGATADHEYNWHDAIHSGGGPCAFDSAAPCDDDDHGTHTVGTMVGDDGAANRIGVAPGARWIACRNMDDEVGTPATYTECFQWMVAPTDGNGLNPDPTRAPDIINNSWGCPPVEGCNFDTLQMVVENTRAAGILVVASAGNSGPLCFSTNIPPALYDASFTVGSTDVNDEIANSSSRGPVTADSSFRLKPDLSAPGVAVRSSIRGGSYINKNGTSMAGPHVAGVAALLLDARPDLAGQVDVIEEILRMSAVPLTTTENCFDIPGTQVPNYTFGYGRIDALAALTGDADADGTDNLNDCRPVDPDSWSLPTAVTDLTLDKTAGGSLHWSPPAPPGGTAPTYDVLRSGDPGDFSGAACLGQALSAGPLTDADPAVVPFYYLIRTRNGCGATLGQDSAGSPRSGADCP